MRRKEGLFVAAQALVMIAVLTLVSLPLVSLQSSTETATSSASSVSTTTNASSSYPSPPSQAVEMVNATHAMHVSLLESRNASAVADLFAPNGTMTWVGTTQGLGGSYESRTDIKLTLETAIGGMSSFQITNVTQTILPSTSAVLVDWNFSFSGHSNIWGNFAGAVLANDSYAYFPAEGVWLISAEHWDFTNFNIQYSQQGGGPPPPGQAATQRPDAESISPDGGYAAVGTISIGGGGNGSVYLVSLRSQSQGVFWRRVTNNSNIESVAVSQNASYVAAGGYGLERLGHVSDTGVLFLFDGEGAQLWNVTAKGSVISLGMSPDGSRIFADYYWGILCLNDAGSVLWNYTFPYGGSGMHIATSGQGDYVVSAVQYMLLPNRTDFSWGVVYLDSQGRLLWSHIGNQGEGVNFVQMSSDGSRVAVGTFVNGENGSVYYFSGKDGDVLWKRQAYTAVQPLFMSSDGGYIASGGNVGKLLFDSSGNILWNDTGYGNPLAFVNGASLVIVGDGTTVRLIGYNGTIAATFDSPGSFLNIVSSSTSPEWVDAEGMVGPGACGALSIYDGVSLVSNLTLC